METISWILIVAFIVLLAFAYYQKEWVHPIIFKGFIILLTNLERFIPSKYEHLSNESRAYIHYLYYIQKPACTIEKYRQVAENEAIWYGLPARFVDQSCAMEEKRVVLYIHGGAYVSGSAHSHAKMLSSAFKWHAKCCDVFFLQYRLCPEYRVEDAVEDALTAFKFLQDDLKYKKITISGGSAGGNLALLLVMTHMQQGKYEIGKTALDTLVLQSPWIDVTTSVEPSSSKFYKEDVIVNEDVDFFAKLFVYRHDWNYAKKISPYFLLKENNDYKIPRCLFIYSGTERVASACDEFYEIIAKGNPGKHHRIVFDGLPHVFLDWHENIPEAEETFRKVFDFIGCLRKE